MVLNRVKVLSAAELDVWKVDAEADTELPSEEGSDFEEGQSDPESQDYGGVTFCSPGSSSSGHWSGGAGAGVGADAGAAAGSGTAAAASSDGGGACAPRAPEPLSALPASHAWVEAVRSTEGGSKAIFLDYDGTLREFEDSPELAVPTAEIHQLLRALNDREDLMVHIISGRSAIFLRSHFGCYGRLVLIAEHERRVAGRFQVWRPDPSDVVFGAGVSSPKTELQDWRNPCRFEMSRNVVAVEGSHVEEKAASLVWHFRGATDIAKAEAAAKTLVGRLLRLRTARRLRELRVTVGHMIVEVSCRNGTKGDIMRRLCDARKRVNKPFEAVMIVGDDVSDESMFEAARKEFLTIKVGRASTRAKYFVDSPAQLRDFLWQLAS